jgi:TonB family protein
MCDPRRIAACPLLLALIVACGAVLAAEETAGGPAVSSTEPVLIPASRVSPEYPPAALAARFQGSVTLRTEVLADGTVGRIEVLDSSAPNLGFEKAAERAIRQWRFEPALAAGQPVVGDQVVRLNFHTTPTADAAWVSASFRPMADIGGAGSVIEPPGAGGRGGVGDNSTAAYRDRGTRVPEHPCGTSVCLYNRRDMFSAPSAEANTPHGSN